MPTKHSTVYTRPGNLDFPSPAVWNADHLSVPQYIPLNTVNVTWTNMPAAATELFGVVHRRARIDLTYASQIRLMARVSTLGYSTSILYAQYSTDESAWVTLTTNSLAIGGGSAGTRVTAWENIPTGALADVFVRIMGSGGDGVVDPILGTIQLQVR